MCNSVRLHGRWLDTPEDLAVALGGTDRLVWQERNPFHRWPAGKEWRVMDCCLCPIDLKATLDKAGLAWKRGDADPMEWFVES